MKTWFWFCFLAFFLKYKTNLVMTFLVCRYLLVRLVQRLYYVVKDIFSVVFSPISHLPRSEKIRNGREFSCFRKGITWLIDSIHTQTETIDIFLVGFNGSVIQNGHIYNSSQFHLNLTANITYHSHFSQKFEMCFIKTKFESVSFKSSSMKETFRTIRSFKVFKITVGKLDLLGLI